MLDYQVVTKMPKNSRFELPFCQSANYFDTVFHGYPNVSVFYYCHVYPIVLHSFPISFACFDNLSHSFAFVNVCVFIALLCMFVLNYLFTKLSYQVLLEY